MRNKAIALILTASMALGIISGCGKQQTISSNTESGDEASFDSDSLPKDQEVAANEEISAQGSTQDKEISDLTENATENIDIESLDSLLGDEEIVYYDKSLVPSVN